MARRRRSRQVRVGRVRIGGNAPISIQSMAKVRTADVKRVVAQIRRLERAGCEIVRVAVKDVADARAIRSIRQKISIPLVADIHFDYRLALESIRSGADKIRINPGNMRDTGAVKAVVLAAKKVGIPIRIGVNSGSVASDGLVRSAMRYVRLCEKLGFRDIVLSLKASSAQITIDAYRRIAKLCDYPLHLGVTASGPCEDGVVKSAIGIGALLADGIGDTIRVSLTAGPEDEVAVAKKILAGSGARHFGPEIISCPTCGRCQVDLRAIVDAVASALERPDKTKQIKKPIRIAIMGCEVNGPGEAREADIGIAAGKEQGALFIKGKIVRRVPEKSFVRVLLKEYTKLLRRSSCAGQKH